MKTRWILVLLTLVLACPGSAQRECASHSYQQQQTNLNDALRHKMTEIDHFISAQIEKNNSNAARTEAVNMIRIPVVVHILYHYPGDMISDEQVISQIQALNEDFRRTNADTSNTPVYFKHLAADTEIEFALATSDPRQRNTTGIIRKYTPIKEWQADDKMKFSGEMGSDAWDTRSYLNIWVCNLDRVMGYSSVMGGPAEKDGIVIGFPVFGTIGTMSGFNMGRTAVHEVGHWLGLKHLWGDNHCGDDFVDDTPKQSGYNIECPSGIRNSCGNTPFGDMYMNYMDFTNDGCMNLFTQGQKARMRTLFAPGGPRQSLLSSTGLHPPLIFETPIPEEPPRWLHANVYPNPASSELRMDLSYDIRWIGKKLVIWNLNGQAVLSTIITSKNQRIDISRLNPGTYILSAKKEDGEMIRQKFVKF